MRLKTTKLRDAIRVSLAVGAAALAFTGSAMAQEQPSMDAKSLDTVNVTGTRIKSQTMTASSPVAEINKEEFQYTGATKVEDLINQYPQLSASFDNFANNGSDGYATVDLRGLGAQRTLTLVNGRRIPKGIGESPDISIIPAALVRRVDVLTGGASAVYGSDAVAGVVNFVLDDEFEGVSVNMGYNAFQHDNGNKLMRGLMDDAGYDYPTGNSGFDGISRNVDLAIGGSFGESGHATAWATWRENDPLLQGQRDYSACALSNGGTACGGSATADPANFYVVAPSAGAFYVQPSAGGTWSQVASPNLYNFAPLNYYQRPDTRYTAGSSIKYEVNEHFKPYLETLFVNRKSSTQIAPSGAFFTDLNVNCATSVIGSLCNDVGITDDEFTVYVAKRNVEGGPRITDSDTNSFSITTGAQGDIDDNWSYDASFTYNRSTTKSENINDFVTTRVRDALLGCQPGAFDGCVPYSVWNDSVTAAEAEALQGVGIVNYETSMRVFNAYVTGNFGYSLPWAGDNPISVVGGVETRTETFKRVADSNMQTGNFTGLGGPTSNVSGDISVKELFLEGAVPLLANAGSLDHLDMQLGYRYSDYDISGGVSTYKAGLGATFVDGKYHLRAGWNRAIRAPNVTELYNENTIGLWSGSDPCAGANPTFTQAQCANTGVTAAQYGRVAANPAGQYNEIGGGNTALQPETANTWTVGFAASPIKGLDLSVDYYDIKIDDAIRAIGSSNILTACGVTGNADICSRVRRNATTGDLFRGSDPDVSGLILNSQDNFGSLHFQGIDLTASYAWSVGPGRLTASMMGSYALKQEYEPVPGVQEVTYDCAGVVNVACNSAEWRHVLSTRYNFDRYTVSLRWRYIGELDYQNTDGTPGTTDVRLVNQDNKVSAYNYFDLSGSMQLGDYVTWTLGVNNIADKEPPLVGGSLTFNGNSLGGYDQAGRYIFTSVGLRF
ncbi:TonB-dependent receptor [Xanthomonas campestris]|uniref:TonB-dependent receptor n=1 Tax=Xanthomonas campestris TaxID=339 RepID=UPI000E715675|nr:TonB-dependent receptor [Xanthomonas campestris]RJU11915.1 TonB-dependent receptor [Xanthomonas campestris]